MRRLGTGYRGNWTVALTDNMIRKAKPADKAYKLTDGGGLYLNVAPTGSKVWRLRFELKGKEKLLTLDPYPDMGLAEAREARTAAKKQLRDGRDPTVEKRRTKGAPSLAVVHCFESTAREWHEMSKDQWSETHANDVLNSLERDIFPEFGADDIREIEAPTVLTALRKVEARGAIETAKRLRQRISAVFVYSIASGIAKTDPAAIVKQALKPLRKGRQPAVVDLDDAKEMLYRVEGTAAHPVTKLAMRLLVLSNLRSSTLLEAPWLEFRDIDPNKPTWEVPPARMKLKRIYKDDEERAHLVPLSRQAVETIEAVRTLTSRSPYLFPNTRHHHKPASENMLGYLLNRAGYHHRHVPHGWRTTFSTVMNERYRHDSRVIDLMLAHTPKDKVEGAYNRAEHIERRRELAQEWADLIMEGQRSLDELLAMRRQ